MRISAGSRAVAASCQSRVSGAARSSPGAKANSRVRAVFSQGTWLPPVAAMTSLRTAISIEAMVWPGVLRWPSSAWAKKLFRPTPS